MADLLEYVKSLRGITAYEETKNYYYANHNCPLAENTKVRIRLDYTVSNDLDDSIIRIGMCPDCGLCLYHRDFQSKSDL